MEEKKQIVLEITTMVGILTFIDDTCHYHYEYQL